MLHAYKQRPLPFRLRAYTMCISILYFATMLLFFNVLIFDQDRHSVAEAERYWYPHTTPFPLISPSEEYPGRYIRTKSWKTRQL